MLFSSLKSSLTIAFRNLGRNRKRTYLALAALAVAQFFVVAVDGFMAGYEDALRDVMTGPLLGHAQIHAPEFREERSMEKTIANAGNAIEALESSPLVETYFPRVFAPSLVAKTEEGFTAVVVGLDVEREKKTGGLLDLERVSLRDGTTDLDFVSAPVDLDSAPVALAKPALVGAVLARRQNLEVGDELALVGQTKDGAMASELVKVTGVVNSSVDLINANGVLIPLGLAQETYGLEGELHEITVRGKNSHEAGRLASSLAKQPALRELEVLPWQELAPQLVQMLSMMSMSTLIILIFIFTAAAAGIANTMVMSTFERAREMGVLLALGATPGRITFILVAETLLLGFLGLALGTLLGSSFNYYLGIDGFSMAALAGGSEEDLADVSFQGISYSFRVFPRMRLTVIEQTTVAMGLTCLPLSALASPFRFGTRTHGGDEKMNVGLKYAFRSLIRSTTRTLVSLFGVGIGVAIGVIAMSWIRGEDGMMAESTARSGQGHLQLTPKGWSETRDPRLRLQVAPETLSELALKDPAVEVAAPQVEAQALLGMGTRVQSVSLLGVDPIAEPKIRRTIQGVTAGRYLKPGDEKSIVIGKELARRLDVELGDELVVTSVAPGGDLNSALLVVIGLVESGSKDVDAQIAHVLLEEALTLSGRKGASRVAILLRDLEELEVAQERLRGRLKAPALSQVEVLNWMEVNPDLVAARQSDAAFSNAVIGVVILLVVLGITSAQLTSVLQRGREFSVLLALGMRRRTLYRLIFSEAALLGLAGGALALLLVSWPLYYLSQIGVDMKAVMGEEGMAINGVLLDTVMKADAGAWVPVVTFSLSLGAALIGAIYPAVYSHRLDPASVLRSRN